MSTEVDRLDEELGAESLELFERIVREMDDEAAVEEMTLADYLGYCAVCYQANDYRHLQPDMTPREMYRAMADNRDAGILEIPPDDPAAFSRWYRERQLGGHPWEICRGGNHTHISLHVTPYDAGWQLLADHSQPADASPRVAGLRLPSPTVAAARSPPRRGRRAASVRRRPAGSATMAGRVQ